MAMGGRSGETFTDINVTPLTDVFLVLLVIMILVAPMVNQTVLKVDPPQQASNTQQKPPDDKGPKIRVEVTAKGVVNLNGVPVTPPDSMTIQDRIRQEQTRAGNNDIPLEMQSEADAQQQYVVAVMDAAAGAGIKRMRVLPLKK
jgi:biopolymer transport protein ExbD